MKVETIISRIDKKKKFISPQEFRQEFDLLWEEAKQILDKGVECGVFFNSSQYDYGVRELKNNEGEKKLQQFLDDLYGEKRKRTMKKIFTLRGQVEAFHKINPFFYDKSKIFWKWDKENKKYSICDETDLLNEIYLSYDVDTINSKLKSELLEALKQVGRNNKPEEPEKKWVQFRENVFDSKTGEFLFKATPKYHFMNPIDWNVGLSEETPTIDKLFIQWVGSEHKQELYEFIAYSITRDRFLQRIWALCGGGSNGKGTYMKLYQKFIGLDNCVSSELKQLSENQFEAAVLYGKLNVVMGEVSYSDLKNTNQIKKIAGEDLMSFQFKGKTPFTAENSAVAVCLTNSLPTTPDKSIGFYRKFHIIDFPNQFEKISEDLVEKIPEEEFENLAKKSLSILKELYNKKSLANEGNFEERVKRYEERSNPVMRFVEEKCEEKDGENTPLREFTNSCNEYLKKKHLRVLTATQTGKILREEGFAVGNRKLNDISMVVILNLKLKIDIEKI